MLHIFEAISSKAKIVSLGSDAPLFWDFVNNV